MVFATAVAFSPEDKGLLSVSADASARATLIRVSGGRLGLFGLALLVVVVSALLSLLVRTYGAH